MRDLGYLDGTDHTLFSRLQKGEAVTVDGREITPEQVLGPPRPGRKVVLTGDTRVSQSIEDLARDCDALVHEGTLSAEMGDRASEFGHTSILDAAKLASRAKARRLFLVHISPRYKEAEALVEEAGQAFPGAVIPEDLEEFEIPYVG